MADFFLVLFLQAAEPEFTSSDSERIECLAAMGDLNAFCRKIERILYCKPLKEKVSGDEV